MRFCTRARFRTFFTNVRISYQFVTSDYHSLAMQIACKQFMIRPKYSFFQSLFSCLIPFRLFRLSLWRWLPSLSLSRPRSGARLTLFLPQLFTKVYANKNPLVHYMKNVTSNIDGNGRDGNKNAADEKHGEKETHKRVFDHAFSTSKKFCPRDSLSL